MDGFYPGDGEGNMPKPPSKPEPESDEAETFLTPKSAFGEVSVGDKQTFEAVHIYEDEIEWKPVSKESKPPKEMPSIDEDIDMAAMAEM